MDFDITNFCYNSKEYLQYIGWAVTIFKVAIPLLIVILGMLDFGKAVVSNKDEEVKKQTKRLALRVLAGFIIFFIPSIVMWLFSLINDYNQSTESIDYETCLNCVLKPWTGCY